MTGGAGGLLLLLPPNLQNDMEADAKEHILALEEELLNAELDIPIYFAEETEELLELYTTLTSEGEVGGLPYYNPEKEDRSPLQEISGSIFSKISTFCSGQRGGHFCHGSFAPERFQLRLPACRHCPYSTTCQRSGRCQQQFVLNVFELFREW